MRSRIPFPHAMIFRMDQEFIFDSQIIALDTNLSAIDESRLFESMEMQGIKLLSSFDVTDLYQVGSIHALYPWSDPKGYFFALYFPLTPIISENAPAEPMTIMVGMIIDRSYAPITTIMLDDIYSVMDQKISLISELTCNILSPTAQEGENGENNSHDESLKLVLKEIRNETWELIESWMSNFNLNE